MSGKVSARSASKRPSQRKLRPAKPKRPYLERVQEDGSRIYGEGGTIHFMADGKVMIEVSGLGFAEQNGKIIGRYNVDQGLLQLLESLQPPFDSTGSEYLFALMTLTKQADFDREAALLLSALGAVRRQWGKGFIPSKSVKFLSVVLALARKHRRPPTKKEITDFYCSELSETSSIEPSDVSKLCEECLFKWLPNAPAGRPRRRRR